VKRFERTALRELAALKALALTKKPCIVDPSGGDRLD
jgi:hypothetical protein